MEVIGAHTIEGLGLTADPRPEETRPDDRIGIDSGKLRVRIQELKKWRKKLQDQ